MNAFRIITGFDGASPFSNAGVTAHADGTFDVRPSWRSAPGISEEAVGGGSRFSIRVENLSGQTDTFRCHVNWEDSRKIRLRFHDWVFVLFPNAADWILYPAELGEAGATIAVPLPPGLTHIGTSPEYGYGKAVGYLKSKAGLFGAAYSSIGTSEEGREIPLLKVDDPEGWAKKEDVLYMGCNHAYESAGSYCAEGMLDWLLSPAPEARYFRSKYRFHFLPMTNPDGVHNGLSRLTAPQGADLNRSREQNDAAWRALKAYIDAVQPTMMLNVHHWMSKTRDGLLANTEAHAEKFKKLMPDLHEDGHYWEVEWTDKALQHAQRNTLSEADASWKDYVRHAFNGTGLTLEFPWFNRNTARMREIGRKALIAFLMADRF